MTMTRRRAFTAVAASALLPACATRSAEAPESRYPPIGAFTTIEGARLHYVDLPPANGDVAAPPAVLIHGASGNVRDFTFAFAARVAAERRVLAFDRPGFGHSERGTVEDAHRPDVQARLLRAATRSLGVERAILVGHSFGAAPSLAWALDAPDSVVGVVDLAGATHPWEGTAGVFYDLGASPALGGVVSALANAFLSEERLKTSIDRIFRPQTAPAGYAEYVGVGLALRRDTLRWNAEDIARLKPFLEAQRARYPSLTAPVEIVHGAVDRIVPLEIHGARLAEEAPNARLTRLADIGHMPHHAAPDACLAAIQRIASA